MNDKKNHDDKKAKQSENAKKYPYRLAYLLRLWCVDESEGFNWQASLEIPKTSKRIGFGSLEELFTYLMDLTTNNEL
jgi:hypothetical protein